MEWDMKLPPNWDLTQLGGSSLDYHLRGRDCSVVLKLGGSEQCVQSGMMVPSSSSSGSAKRPRALPTNGATLVSCLVEGCVSDLSKCREYHRRHKVCEVHSKTAVVMVGGREQRFCQQCSRFHLLVEFDEVKRSCRKRLDGHNRRRRKPQHDFINTRSLFTNHPGAGFSVYPQIFPAAASAPNWSRIIKSEEDVLYSNSLPLHLSDRQQSSTISPCIYKEGKQFSFLQEGDAAIRSRMVSQTAFEQETKTIASSETVDCKLFPNEIPRVFSTECALSLLSSSSQTSSINLSQVVPPGDRIPMALPLVSGFQFNDLGRYSCPQASDNVSRLLPTVFSCSGMKDEQMVNVFIPDASETGLHCGSIFQVCGDGSSDGISQSLPFPWQQ